MIWLLVIIGYGALVVLLVMFMRGAHDNQEDNDDTN